MTKSDAGKGDDPRPMFIPYEEFSDRWDLAFGKKQSNKQINESGESTRTNENSGCDSAGSS